MSRRNNPQQQAHWSGMNEFSCVMGIRCLFWLCRMFGRWPFRIALYPVVLWYVVFTPVARRASLAYLQRIASLTVVQGGYAGVIQHFSAFAEMMLDKMLLWADQFGAEAVRYAGADHLTRLVNDKRGVLLICSHLGNPELCRVLTRQRRDLHLTVLVHTRHAEQFNALLTNLNPGSNITMLQITEMTPATAMTLSEKIAQGEFVVIAGDRVPLLSLQPLRDKKNRSRVAIVDFLGAPAAFPVGPYVLANALQCPVYMMFSMRCGDHVDISFELLRESVRIPRHLRHAVLSELAGAYAARLAYHTLRSPLEWFNFYDFWQLPEMDESDA